MGYLLGSRQGGRASDEKSLEEDRCNLQEKDGARGNTVLFDETAVYVLAGVDDLFHSAGKCI